MPMRATVGLLLSLLLLLPAIISTPTRSQDATGKQTFKIEQLDQMLAPIALYPDELLANVLMASTYPLDIVQAARWRKEPANAKLKDDALAKALEPKTWDPSIKALTQFPEVLQMMSDQLEWTQELGDAFLAQEDNVFTRIQFLRQKADEAGNLKSNEQQKVTKKTSSDSAREYIVIEPAQPEYIYVPVYQPSVVYGSWWYPSYPPYYWNWYPGATFVRGLFWGAGFAVANEIWGWGNCNWNSGHIDIDVNRYNKINIKGDRITDGRWKHNPQQRGPVPYRDKATRDKYAKDGKLSEKNKDFSGFDKGSRDKAGGADRVKDKLATGGESRPKNKVGGADRAKDKAGARDVAKTKDKGRDTKPKTPAKDIKKPSSKPATKAMDVKPRAQVTKDIDRGSASRKSAAAHSKARGGGGGGAKRGGGGRGGGGGRR